MCGLNGVLALNPGAFRVKHGLIEKMRDTMAHRGPDGAGSWVSADGRVGLGHRRLSILDLSAAADQPMTNEDGSLRIVFNGEIYNHADLRRELEDAGGHTWQTDHSDTEVILHAYETWGIDCLHRFRGMFAIALWDDRNRALWLARDRIGVKPLYFCTHHGRFSFASEIKALLADPDQPRAVNEEGLFDYLSFLTVPAPDTLFAGIHKLPAGTRMRITADGAREPERWWDACDHVRPCGPASDLEIAGRVREELRRSVRLHKVSDVPVGVFLSGGIDSSTNAALFSEGEDRAVRTFSIGYAGHNDSYQDELPYARLMAQRVGAEHRERVLWVEDLLDFLPRMVWLQDEPIADPVCVPVYYVSKLARDAGVVVCQVGEGADELFCGYPVWREALARQRAADLFPAPHLARIALAGSTLAGRTRSRSHELFRRVAARQPVFWGGAEAFTHEQKLHLLSPRLRAAAAGRTSWDTLRPIRARFENAAWEQSHLNWMTYLDLNLRLPELLLMRVDKMSMGVSLEGRVPFLDHEFVSLALGIPSAAKVRGGELKHILKLAVRGLIPDELIARPKQGFSVPIREWLYGVLGSHIDTELQEFCARTDLLDASAVRALVSGRNDARVWNLFNLALWWKTFFC